MTDSIQLNRAVAMAMRLSSSNPTRGDLDDAQALLRELGSLADRWQVKAEELMAGSEEPKIRVSELRQHLCEEFPWLLTELAVGHESPARVQEFLSQVHNGKVSYMQVITLLARAMERDRRRTEKATAVLRALLQEQQAEIQELMADVISHRPLAPMVVDMPVGDPIGYMSPHQLPLVRDPVDPDDAGGPYIPMRKTQKGNFTLALYAMPHEQPTESPDQLPLDLPPTGGAA